MRGNMGSRYLGVKQDTVWFLTFSLLAPSHVRDGDLKLRQTSIRRRKSSSGKDLLPIAEGPSKPKAAATAFSARSSSSVNGFPRRDGSGVKKPSPVGKENAFQG